MSKEKYTLLRLPLGDVRLIVVGLKVAIETMPTEYEKDRLIYVSNKLQLVLERDRLNPKIEKQPIQAEEEPARKPVNYNQEF